MNISICITALNEEGTIAPLLDSLLNQSKKAQEIVIVDAGSTDKTQEIIRHYQKKHGDIKLLIEKCSRAKGRNLSIEIAKGDVIAITDAGCVADIDWLKKITAPFVTGRVDVVAGFYKMVSDDSLGKAMSVFLGVMPRKFDVNFLPSTRSIALTKKIWVDVGGFPENVEGTAEDTMFNYKLIKEGIKISRVKDAIVEWGMPKTIKSFQLKIYNYAKGDAKSKLWIFPGKGLTSHNIKALFVLLRYMLGTSLLIYSIKFPPLLTYLVILLFAYFYWSFRKIQNSFGDWRVTVWGPILQIASDISVIRGFLSGILSKND